jgi:acetate kinase
VDVGNVFHLLTINAGSSSIKFSLFEINGAPKRLFEGVIDNIGQPVARIVAKGADASNELSESVDVHDHAAAAGVLIDWLKPRIPSGTLSAIGHRIVHGGPKYHETQIISGELLANLREYVLFDPEHLPIEIRLVEEFQKLFPGVKQIACFDTAFHHELPSQARLLPIPRRYEAQGVYRYGFHGLSYAFIMQELGRLDGAEAANGRVIIAHLGNGASLTAVRGGKSIDTTMGLTPASGVPMSTRSGDLDPGLAVYLARSEGMTADQLNNLVNFQSGLLGLSETTSDMKKLLENEAADDRAKDTVNLFCYQVKKSIGSLSAALGGLDTLVFTGGMGENAPVIRSRICQGLGFLGIEIDDARNAASNDVITTDSSHVAVRVIHTDESSMIAQEVVQILKTSGQ